MAPSVHDEERSIPIAEVVVVLALDRGVVVRFGIVQAERIRCIRERLLRAVSLTDEVVDDLQRRER